MSDTEFDAEAQSTKLHAIYGRHHHHHHHHHHEHTLSAVDLTIKLEQLQIDTNITEVDELQKWSHEALHEILDRLEHQRRESEFFQSEDLGLVPGMEENGSGRMRHTLGLSPEVLRDLSSRHHSLKQSHGQANLRHSGHDDGT
ncbi:hypothetical protein KI688_003361 [Linnemannia hyalina]|uniref:Uncharacterized protein n=1 Tax=Linnemannia hyalina TaxID=64524 RepID=A0A9P7XPC2_9FUNG|nr:hypothetical protein KI688_003361 [Linnemannia hyalina]